MKAGHPLVKHLALLLAQSGYSQNDKADEGVNVFSLGFFPVAFMPAGMGQVEQKPKLCDLIVW